MKIQRIIHLKNNSFIIDTRLYTEDNSYIYNYVWSREDGPTTIILNGKRKGKTSYYINNHYYSESQYYKVIAK